MKYGFQLFSGLQQQITSCRNSTVPTHAGRASQVDTNIGINQESFLDSSRSIVIDGSRLGFR